jgi:hypothetical protein
VEFDKSSKHRYPRKRKEIEMKNQIIGFLLAIVLGSFFLLALTRSAESAEFPQPTDYIDIAKMRKEMLPITKLKFENCKGKKIGSAVFSTNDIAKGFNYWGLYIVFDFEKKKEIVAGVSHIDKNKTERTWAHPDKNGRFQWYKEGTSREIALALTNDFSDICDLLSSVLE